MRIVNGVLAILLILFAVVQYNDPDGLFWAAVYGVGAIWCGLAAFRSSTYRSNAAFGLFGLCLLAAIAGMAHFWPDTPDWWKQDVWWETETAREGMGMMILLAALIVAGVGALGARRS